MGSNLSPYYDIQVLTTFREDRQRVVGTGIPISTRCLIFSASSVYLDIFEPSRTENCTDFIYLFIILSR